MNVYAKLRTDRSTHGIGQCNDIRSFCASAIHQHQRLLIVYRRRALCFTLPATQINHPSGRNLHPVSIDLVKRHLRIFCL